MNLLKELIFFLTPYVSIIAILFAAHFIFEYFSTFQIICAIGILVICMKVVSFCFRKMWLWISDFILND